MAVALTCAVALLGACSDDEPEAPPTSTASSPSISETTETTPAPTPPSLPPEATTPDAAGAAAFVRHWFDLVSYAYATGNTEPIRNASTAECESCNNILETIEDQYTDGGRIEGGELSVLAAEAPTPVPGQVALVTTRVSQAALQGLSADGEVEMEQAADPGVTSGFFLQPTDTGWLAAGIGEG